MSAPLSVASLEPAIRRPRRQRAAVILLAGLLALLVGAGWLLWDNRRLDVTSYQVPVQQLPAAADGVRIAQLSDVHAASFGTFPDRIVSAVRSAEPDLIALTGDLIDIRTADLGASLDLAEQLAGIAPVYYVLGNHEADSPLRTELLEGLEEREVHVLRDEATTLELPETTLTLVGLDDPRVDHAADREATPPVTTLAGLDMPRQSPTVLLAHWPELWSDFRRSAGGLRWGGGDCVLWRRTRDPGRRRRLIGHSTGRGVVRPTRSAHRRAVLADRWGTGNDHH
ncbi:metallophosphoesterase [Brachybacterium sp. GCM10030252]|uniref:metallophosphoesterase n=1 Tax=Brachybacterium sp. GCM10030252 TaxID=3273380 RepID=UPI003622AEBC